MAAFDIMKMFSGSSDNTGEGRADDYKDIVLDIESITATSYNKYSMEGIQELAASIEMSSGLQEPLVIGRVDGEYLLISGHRRRVALQLLIEEGQTQYRQVPCRYKDMSITQFRIELLSGNTFNRVLSDYDMMIQAAEWKEVFTQARREGLLILEKGQRVRDYVAAALNQPASKVGQLNNIQNNAAEEIKEQLRDGNIGITAADAAARLPEEEQKQLAEDIKAGKDIKSEEILRMAAEKKAAEQEAAKEEDQEDETEEEEDSQNDPEAAGVEEKEEPDKVVEKQRRQQVSDTDTTEQERENARRLHLLKMLEKYYTYMSQEEENILSGILEDCKRRKREYSLDEDCGSTI